MTRPSTRDLRARSVLEIAPNAVAQLRFRLQGETPESVANARSSALSFIAGHRVSEVKILVEVARLPARRLGLTGALGTVAAQRDGVYTGELVGGILHGPAKAEAVRSPAAHEGGWRRRDYRTGRKAARLGLLTAGVSGVTLGAVPAAMAIRKRVS
jgi:hypothetical protein